MISFPLTLLVASLSKSVCFRNIHSSWCILLCKKYSTKEKALTLGLTEVKDGALLQEHVDLLNVGLGNKGQLLEGTLELAVILGNGAVDLLDNATGGTLGAVGVGLELSEFLGVHDGNLHIDSRSIVVM